MHCEDIPLLLKNKSTNQRKWIIEDTVKDIMNYCRYVHKPLIIEKLNFEQKKKDFRIYNQNKKYNKMLSEFSYRSITEKIYSRAYKDGIGVMEVNPAYTSLIGKLKYADQKGISIHKAASFVIARRGMGYKERLPKRLYDNINEKCYTRWRNYNKLVLN